MYKTLYTALKMYKILTQGFQEMLSHPLSICFSFSWVESLLGVTAIKDYVSQYPLQLGEAKQWCFRYFYICGSGLGISKGELRPAFLYFH